MSFPFEIDDRTVWDPALAIGTTFAGYVAVCSRLVRLPSGFSADWETTGGAYIDADKFEAFVEELFRRSHVESHNSMLQALVDPVLFPSAVMLQRAGRTLSFESAPGMADRLLELGRHMCT